LNTRRGRLGARDKAAFSVSTSSGRASTPAFMKLMESQNQRFAATFFHTQSFF
jgi:hypothetical protein